MTELVIEHVPTADLVPYANNARIHTEEQVKTIAESIKEFGFNDPIGVWTNTDGEAEIVEGHGRVLAAQILGLDEVPVINLDHLSDEQRKAYAIVHNKTTDNSEFDLQVLASELDALESFDMSEFGFDDFDVAEMATAMDDFVPRSEEIDVYSEQGESELKSYNVVICCLDAMEQQWLAEFLREDGRMKRLYMCSEIMDRFEDAKTVQLRATQCGGKTTTVNQYIERMGRKRVFTIPTSQGQAKCTETSNNIIVLGVYDGKTGGCDHYANRKMVYEAATKAMDMRPAGVVFEGLIYSNTCKLAEDLARAAKARGFEYRAVYLHREFEDALAKVYERNGGKPIREGLLFNKALQSRKSYEKLKRMGYDTRRVDVAEVPYEKMGDILYEALHE